MKPSCKYDQLFTMFSVHIIKIYSDSTSVHSTQYFVVIDYNTDNPYTIILHSNFSYYITIF